MLFTICVIDKHSSWARPAGADREDSEVAEGECTQDRKTGFHGGAFETTSSRAAEENSHCTELYYAGTGRGTIFGQHGS